jgi:hypothetical protein
MGVSREGVGLLYKYIICPAGIFVFFVSIFGGFNENSGIMAIVGLISTIGGYFGPQVFGE